ncbi:hypothetical protein Mapa_002086 [Marchantia paleacea]|nr:hypothetical protein Mapa_002086 [Marchantia paleacea]
MSLTKVLKTRLTAITETILCNHRLLPSATQSVAVVLVMILVGRGRASLIMITSPGFVAIVATTIKNTAETVGNFLTGVQNVAKKIARATDAICDWVSRTFIRPSRPPGRSSRTRMRPSGRSSPAKLHEW